MTQQAQYGQQRTTAQYVTWDDNKEEHKCHFCCCRCCHIRIACTVIAVLQMLGSAITAIKALVYLVRFGSYILGGSIAYTVIFQIFLPILLILTAILVLIAIQKTNASLVMPHIAVMIIGMVLALVTVILVILVMVGAISASIVGIGNQQQMQDINDAYRENRAAVQGAIIGISVFFLLVMLAAFILQAYFIWLFKKLMDYLKDKRAAMGGTAQMTSY